MSDLQKKFNHFLPPVGDKNCSFSNSSRGNNYFQSNSSNEKFSSYSRNNKNYLREEKRDVNKENKEPDLKMLNWFGLQIQVHGNNRKRNIRKFSSSLVNGNDYLTSDDGNNDHVDSVLGDGDSGF